MVLQLLEHKSVHPLGLRRFSRELIFVWGLKEANGVALVAHVYKGELGVSIFRIGKVFRVKQ